MRRKVVKHGPSTLIISLPVKWTKQYGITRGSELDVEEKGKTLLVSTESHAEPRRIEVDVSKLDRTSIIFYIRSLYRRGYSEIKVNFNKNTVYHFRVGKDVNVISIIHEEVNRLIGMEIIEQRGNFCIIKEITESSEKEFDSIFRKVFFQLEGAFEDMISSLEKNDLSTLSTIEEKHDTITKFVSYCIRLLNQGKLNSPENSPQFYHILISVDVIADIFKYFCRDVIDSKHAFRKDSIRILNEMLKLIGIYSKMQFKFDATLAWDLQNSRDAIKKKLQNSLMEKPDDFVFINYLSPIMEILRIMTETTLSCMEQKQLS
jgi:phosphate uptake regulator